MSTQTVPSRQTSDLFATPLIRAQHPALAALVQPLRNVILGREAIDQGVRKSNVGGWHSNIDMLDWAGSPATELGNLCAQLAQEALSLDSIPGDTEPGWTLDMWANVNRDGHSNQLHCHNGAMVSAVFYVATGNGSGGELILEDPRFPMAYQIAPGIHFKNAAGEAAGSQHAAKPIDGEMILFPAWLRHSVNPYRGTEPRISVAINLTLNLVPKGSRP